MKDFFSPSWLVDLFKGNQRSETIEIEDEDDEEEHDEVSQGIDQTFNPGFNERASSSRPQETLTAGKIGNGHISHLFYESLSFLSKHLLPRDLQERLVYSLGMIV